MASRTQRDNQAGTPSRPAPGPTMNDNERKLTYSAAAISVAGGIYFVIAYATGHKMGNTTTHPSTVAIYTAGDMVFGLLLALGARRGSRLLAGMVAMVGGVLLWGTTILGFPFIGLGGWLIIQNSRAVRAARDRGEPLQLPWRRRRSTEPVDEAESRPRPTASKRYTPPKASRD
ncbi:MAG TPA: hypothetical protein VFH45_08850 [Acidimicrobiales bacterium]|nr:hypothetical protein [Acidimicrobiales bacterium]